MNESGIDIRYMERAHVSLTKEEMKRENRAARANYVPEGLRELCAAICLLAVEDYKRCSLGLRPHGGYVRKQNKDIIEECEVFFRGPIFGYIVNYEDLASVIREIDEAPLERVERMIDNRIYIPVAE